MRQLVVVVVVAALWGMLARGQWRPRLTSIDQTRSRVELSPRPQPQPPERIGGQVLDALTGQAVPRARVRGWGKVQVGKDGRFSAAAHQDVSVLVDAPYYDRQKVVLEPGRFREIRLVPATPVD